MKLSWSEYCKQYAQKNGVSYKEAMSECKSGWQQYKAQPGSGKQTKATKKVNQTWEDYYQERDGKPSGRGRANTMDELVEPKQRPAKRQPVKRKVNQLNDEELNFDEEVEFKPVAKKAQPKKKSQKTRMSATSNLGDSTPSDHQLEQIADNYFVNRNKGEMYYFQ